MIRVYGFKESWYLIFIYKGLTQCHLAYLIERTTNCMCHACCADDDWILICIMTDPMPRVRKCLQDGLHWSGGSWSWWPRYVFFLYSFATWDILYEGKANTLKRWPRCIPWTKDHGRLCQNRIQMVVWDLYIERRGRSWSTSWRRIVAVLSWWDCLVHSRLIDCFCSCSFMHMWFLLYVRSNSW